MGGVGTRPGESQLAVEAQPRQHVLPLHPQPPDLELLLVALPFQPQRVQRGLVLQLAEAPGRVLLPLGPAHPLGRLPVERRRVVAGAQVGQLPLVLQSLGLLRPAPRPARAR